VVGGGAKFPLGPGKENLPQLRVVFVPVWPVSLRRLECWHFGRTICIFILLMHLYTA
jgi:hypothetical protein